MKDQFIRTALLFSEQGIESLKSKRVALFGIGGVGGHAAEAIARSGVGAIDLIDGDTVSESNINRQAVAFHSTIGQYKTEVMRERILDINPDCKVECRNEFFDFSNMNSFDFSKYDYIVDAIDSVSSKVELICKAKAEGVAIISSMGAGNKLDPTAFMVADIYKTDVCPLAKVMRSHLRKRGIKKLKTVFSKEMPIVPNSEVALSDYDKNQNRSVPGSVSFVPSVAGLIIASEVIKDLVGDINAERT